VKIGVEEAQPIGAFFFVSSGSSLLNRGLVLELFGNSTLIIVSYCSYCSLVYEFTLFASRRE